MDKAALDKMAEEIEEAFVQGGDFSHNVITASLQTMAKTDRDRANTIYADLVERGF